MRLEELKLLFDENDPTPPDSIELTQETDTSTVPTSTKSTSTPMPINPGFSQPPSNSTLSLMLSTKFGSLPARQQPNQQEQQRQQLQQQLQQQKALGRSQSQPAAFLSSNNNNNQNSLAGAQSIRDIMSWLQPQSNSELSLPPAQQQPSITYQPTTSQSSLSLYFDDELRLSSNINDDNPPYSDPHHHNVLYSENPNQPFPSSTSTTTSSSTSLPPNTSAVSETSGISSSTTTTTTTSSSRLQHSLFSLVNSTEGENDGVLFID